MTIRLASFDMAGTTIDEGGAVYAVLRTAVERATRRDVPDDLLSRWSGTDKREAIVGILTALDEDLAQTDRIFAAFSDDLVAAYEADPPVLLPGVAETVQQLRAQGVKVALQTGYRREVAEGLLDVVGWRVGRDVDALATAEDVTASRPAPFLVFRTMEATGVVDVRDVLVAGDTVNDVTAGTRAGARFVVGVLTGAHTVAELGEARHTHLLPSVVDVPELLSTER
ncbi:phosphonatase-like hydrolase [Amnibacterium kyonggiense]|uniref:Phosphonatase-like hydrolase n=1 Tax=Amnibacterium kyonggiense TaxID=595671 RepID=A0A4R7FM44_9MICO|nr:phosphonatase-like hydrolase [Amnibacterium kyonggiense]TDS77456.1 phosphonatase-like hydrolase [Amnibacterium kyonggiense]